MAFFPYLLLFSKYYYCITIFNLLSGLFDLGICCFEFTMLLLIICYFRIQYLLFWTFSAVVFNRVCNLLFTVYLLNLLILLNLLLFLYLNFLSLFELAAYSFKTQCLLLFNFPSTSLNLRLSSLELTNSFKLTAFLYLTSSFSFFFFTCCLLS